MSSKGPSSEILYKGVKYRLRSVTAGGLGTTTRQVMDLIEAEYNDDIRKLSYEGGAFVLHITLKWKFSTNVEATFTVPLDDRDAAYLYYAMVKDGGEIRFDLEDTTALPADVVNLLEYKEQRPKQLAAGLRRRNAALLRWKGEHMLLVPPDQEVAQIRFRLCAPGRGFSISDWEYPDAPRDVIENYAHDLHVLLMNEFPGATIDVSIVDKDPHCGHPVVLNRNGAELKEHNAKIRNLASGLWREHYMEYRSSKQG